MILFYFIELSLLHPNSTFSLSKAMSRSCISHLRNQRKSCGAKINTDLPLQIAKPLQPWTGGGNKVETLLGQKQGTHLMVGCAEKQVGQLRQGVHPQNSCQAFVGERFLDSQLQNLFEQS